jgi:hypothetical protein
MFYTSERIREGSCWKSQVLKSVLGCIDGFFYSLFLSCWLLWSYWSQQKRKLDRMIELESGFLLVWLCMCVSDIRLKGSRNLYIQLLGQARAGKQFLSVVKLDWWCWKVEGVYLDGRGVICVCISFQYRLRRCDTFFIQFSLLKLQHLAMIVKFYPNTQ